MPLITVAIPSYNHAKYVAESIRGALDQTFEDFELLIVDDASTDNSVEIIKSFSDPRIRFIPLKQNLGICRVANICVEEAKGKYLCTVGSDDVMEKTKLEKQLKFLQQNPSYKASFTGITIINEESKINQKKTTKYTKIFEKDNRSRFEWLNHFFHVGNCLAAPTLMVETQVLKDVGGFDLRMSQAHDFDLWVKICAAGYDIGILQEKLLKYREREKNMNMSSNTVKTRVRLVFDNEKILNHFLDVPFADLKRVFADSVLKDFQPINEVEETAARAYLLHLEALKGKFPYHQQFALNTIYNILGLNGASEVLERKFGFKLRDYFDLVGRNQIGMAIEAENNRLSVKIKNNKLLKKIF
jgi:glycosyltransferase involved in cell wall biosynthesis